MERPTYLPAASGRYDYELVLEQVLQQQRRTFNQFKTAAIIYCI